MKKLQEYVVKGKKVFIGLEDSKRTWKICVRCGQIVIHEASMPTVYENLRSYLRKHFPECEIQLIYEAGFSGFGLYDQLQADGITCIVTPPHTVTQEKMSFVKTDQIDARRLAKNLENGDYKICH